MHKPDKHQITYVRVPQTDLTIVSEAAKEEEMKMPAYSLSLLTRLICLPIFVLKLAA